MSNGNFDVEFIHQVTGQMLCAVNRAVLTARAAKAYLQVGELAFNEALGVRIYQFVYAVQEGKHLSVIFQELDNLGVGSVELAVILILAGVVYAAAVKDIAATVTGSIGRNTLFVSETVNMYRQAMVLGNLVELRHGRELH